MTEHGFGMVKIGDEHAVSRIIIKKFAKLISRVPCVIRTHILNPKGSTGIGYKVAWKDYHIIFEFGDIPANCQDEYPMGYAEFFREIESITVRPNWRIIELAYCIIEDSFP